MDPNKAMATTQTRILKRRMGICQESKKKIMKKHKEEICLAPYLSDDIMWHIFNRIPAISLVENCMFLRKQWSNLISNQDFVKAHFLRSRRGMIFLEKINNEGRNIQLMKFMEFKGAEITEVYNLLIFKNQVHVLSYCGGLFLISDATCPDNFVINPITKESILIPRRSKDSLWRVLVCDQASMDYKIVDLSYKQGYVLTLLGLDGSCKQIKAPEYPYGQPVLINGVLYCVANKKGIYCLDLSTETFSHFNWPINVDSIRGCFERLDVGGSFCVAAYHIEKVSIWMLKQQKWEEICCIDKEHLPNGEQSLPLHVYGYLDNEDLFVFSSRNNRLNAYEVKTKQWRIIKTDEGNRCCGIHVSSLLPLTSKRVSQW